MILNEKNLHNFDVQWWIGCYSHDDDEEATDEEVHKYKIYHKLGY